MIQVIVTPAAEAQIREIDAWRRENRLAAPEIFAQEPAASVALIQTSPHLGRRRRHAQVPGLCRVLLRATRYHIYYAPVDNNRLFVLAVWSAVRGSGPRLERPE